MIKVNFSAYGTYKTDSLYQWDKNQVLSVEGINVTVSPEVHFTNADMGRAIVKQGSITDGVLTADIPNSLLQSNLMIKAYICVYDENTFKTIETINIPVIARKKPEDYVLSISDDEYYSFVSMENHINNIIKTINKNYENNVTALSTRVDNLVAHNNDTDGNSELVDMRVDKNGKTYVSAGNHMRQIEEDVDTIKASLGNQGGSNSGTSGGLTTHAINLLVDILRSVGQYTDKDIATKITTLEVALSQNTSTGGGETGGGSESGGGSGSESSGLLTDGLQGFFDLRNAKPVIDTKAGSTIINASVGSGSLSAWSASTMKGTDDYGSILSRSLAFSTQNDSMSKSELGVEFTIFIKFYSINGSVAFISDFTRASNTALLGYGPKYNTSAGTANVTVEPVGSRASDGYYDIAITVNRNICKLYVNGSLAKTTNGDDLSGFVSWINTFGLGFNNDVKVTCAGVWNKALTDAEIIYTNSYGKSLEVK